MSVEFFYYNTSILQKFIKLLNIYYGSYYTFHSKVVCKQGRIEKIF